MTSTTSGDATQDVVILRCINDNLETASIVIVFLLALIFGALIANIIAGFFRND